MSQDCGDIESKLNELNKRGIFLEFSLPLDRVLYIVVGGNPDHGECENTAKSPNWGFESKRDILIASFYGCDMQYIHDSSQMEIGKRSLPFIRIQNQGVGLKPVPNTYTVRALWVTNSNIKVRPGDVPSQAHEVKIPGYPVHCYLLYATCPIYSKPENMNKTSEFLPSFDIFSL